MRCADTCYQSKKNKKEESEGDRRDYSIMSNGPNVAQFVVKSPASTTPFVQSDTTHSYEDFALPSSISVSCGPLLGFTEKFTDGLQFLETF